jgi:hypothetical protein
MSFGCEIVISVSHSSANTWMAYDHLQMKIEIGTDPICFHPCLPDDFSTFLTIWVSASPMFMRAIADNFLQQ